MSKEPKSELARYAFGYSNKKPGLAYWLVQILMFAAAIAIFIANGVTVSVAGAHHPYGQDNYVWEEPAEVHPFPIDKEVLDKGWILKGKNRNTNYTKTEYSIEVEGYGTISWQHERTPNILCSPNDETIPEPPEVCADTLNVIGTPNGFIAIPQSQTVEEGGQYEIWIVPELVG